MAVRMASRKSASLAKGITSRSIPKPTGQYTVGCVDLMHKLEGDNDGLLVRLFYPTTPQLQEGAGYQYSRWMPHAKYAKTTFNFIMAMVPGLRSDAMDVFSNPYIPAFEGAPLYHKSMTSSSNRPTLARGEIEKQLNGPIEKSVFPVIVFAHGMGGMRTVSSSICCDLASHGYVVVAVEHRDGSACTTLRRVPGPNGQLINEWKEFYFKKMAEKEFDLRNKQVKQRATDAKQALNMLYLLNDGADIQNMLEAGNGSFDFGQFKDSLDIKSAAVMGHSFGGAATIQTLSEDPRFICGIGLDAWILPIDLSILDESGIKQPLLFINSFDWQWKRNIQRMMKLTKSSLQCSIVTIKDSHHFNQTDMPFTISHCFDHQPNMVESRIDPHLAHKVNMELCHAFLRRHLLKDPAYQQTIPSLDRGVGSSEYVIHGTNVDLSETDASIAKL